MPKSKGAGSSTPKLKQMETAKDSALDSPAVMGATITRSLARRLSISVTTPVSPPKRTRRSSISRKTTETSSNLDESTKQDTFKSLTVGEINEEIISKTDIEKASPSLSISKKRKSMRLNGRESAEKTTEFEVQVSDSAKKGRKSRKSCEEADLDNSFTGMKSTTRYQSRKSMIMEKIEEHKTQEDLEDIADNVELSNANGIGDQGQQILNSGCGSNEEKSAEPMEKPRRKTTRKSTCSKEDHPVVELQVTPQIVSKKTKLSSKKTASPITIEQTPQSDPSPFAEKLAETPKNFQTPAVENTVKTPSSVSNKSVIGSAEKPEVGTAIGKTPTAERLSSNDNQDGTPLSVLNKSAKLSAKKAVVERAIEETPKSVESQSNDNIDKTPVSLTKKSTPAAKLSAKKAVGESAVEETPKAVESPSNFNIDKTPVSLSKKSTPAAKLSAKKAAGESAIEGTPKAVESPSNFNIDKTPVSLSKKSTPAAKLSAKKAVGESAIEGTPKAVESPSNFNIDKTPVSLSKKSTPAAKLSAKKAAGESAIEGTPKSVELLSNDNIDKTPVSLSQKSTPAAKLSAKKSTVEIAKEETPKSVELPSNDNIGKTPVSLSAAKLSAKKTDIETAVDKTPKAVETLSTDNTPLKVSKKKKKRAKRSVLIDKPFTPNNAQLPPNNSVTKTPEPVSKKIESSAKLPAKKSFSKDERTPNKIQSPTEEILAKAPTPVLKKPSSPVKLAAKKTVIEDDTDSDEDSDAESRKEIMRSAEKRIIRNLSTSESESRNHVKVLHLPVVDVRANQQMEASGDSDSAPEDVTFDASRQSALELLKQTVDSIKRDKQLRKEKRKEMLEIWRQRKEENLIRLKESKANRDDASCSSSEESLHERNGLLKIAVPPQGKKTYIEEETSLKSNLKPNLKRLPADIVESLPKHLPKVPKMSSPPPENSEKAKQDKGKKRKAGVNGEMSKRPVHPKAPNMKADVDFTPLSGGGKTTFGVVSLGEPKLKTVSQIAANFKQDLLYGSRICRVPTSSLAHNRKKLQVNIN